MGHEAQRWVVLGSRAFRNGGGSGRNRSKAGQATSAGTARAAAGARPAVKCLRLKPLIKLRSLWPAPVCSTRAGYLSQGGQRGAGTAGRAGTAASNCPYYSVTAAPAIPAAAARQPPPLKAAPPPPPPQPLAPAIAAAGPQGYLTTSRRGRGTCARPGRAPGVPLRGAGGPGARLSRLGLRPWAGGCRLRGRRARPDAGARGGAGRSGVASLSRYAPNPKRRTDNPHHKVCRDKGLSGVVVVVVGLELATWHTLRERSKGFANISSHSDNLQPKTRVSVYGDCESP